MNKRFFILLIINKAEKKKFYQLKTGRKTGRKIECQQEREIKNQKGKQSERQDNMKKRIKGHKKIGRQAIKKI